MPRIADPALQTLWRRRLRRQPDSGLTIQQFCKREGVSTASFHAWKRRFALIDAFPTALSNPPAFVRVVAPAIHGPQPGGDVPLVTIQLANGGQVLLPVAAGIEFVREVVATVARFPAAREGSPC